MTGNKRGNETDPLIPKNEDGSKSRSVPPPPPPKAKDNAPVAGDKHLDSAVELTSSKSKRAIKGPDRSKKRVVKVADALLILGLGKYPYHAQIQAAYAAQAERYENNPRKQNELILARNALNKYQGQLLGNFKAAFLKENSLDSELAAWKQKYEKHYLKGVVAVNQQIDALKALNEKYFFDVSQPNADLSVVNDKYYEDTKKLYKAIHSSGIEPSDLEMEFTRSAQSLRVDLDKRLLQDEEGKLKYAPMEGAQIAVDPIAAYQAVHADYLQMILELKQEFGDFQEALDEVHDAIQTLGKTYMDGMQAERPDIEKLSADYAAGFKAVVDKAHNDFGTQDDASKTAESGASLWACLSSLLRFFCVLSFCFRSSVSEQKEKENPHRFHAVGSASIEDRWQQWQLDTMPKFDQDAYHAQSVGKNSG
ncbi:MAG: hypothetical protein NXI01_09120 [Gammaproteobacteria bacterium]|nr:hypothetical protein [Gammaproteobacteria bacterium]